MSLIGVGGLIYTIRQTHGALGEARRGNRISLLVERRSRRESREAGADAKINLIETQKSAAAMSKVAEALSEQLRLTEDITHTNKRIAKTQQAVSQLQLRAYISVTIDEATFPEHHKNLRFAASPVLANNGGTPAVNVRHRTCAGIFPVPLPSDVKLDVPALDGEPDMVPHGQPRIMSGVVADYIDAKDVAKVMWGEGLALYVWGAVSYQDAFGKNHSVEFCHQMYWLFDAEGKPAQVRGFYTPGRNKAD